MVTSLGEGVESLAGQVWHSGGPAGEQEKDRRDRAPYLGIITAGRVYVGGGEP